MKIRTRDVVVALALVIMPDMLSAQTNGFVLQCLSARTSGRGCVTRAQADAPTSLFRDPAGITAFDRAAFEINAAPFVPSLTFQNSSNTGTNDGALHAYPMASFAYVGSPIGKLSWAVGMEPIGGFGSDFRLQHALLSGASHTLLDYESFFAAAKFGPTVAFKLSPAFSIGASVSGLYAQIRDFRMPFTMAPSAAKGLGGIPQLDPAVYGPLFQQFTEMTAYGDSKGYSGLTWTADAGVAYRNANGIAVSASWSPKRAIVVDGGTATIDMTAQFSQMMQAMIMARMQAYGESQSAAQTTVMQQLGSAGLDLNKGVTAHYDAATTITLPQTIGAGVSVPAGKKLTLAGELEWRQWSKAENTMPFDLTSGDNSNINIMLNANPSDGKFYYPFPLEWQDALSGKIGFSYKLAGNNALRAGFMYGKNPVPTNTVFITFPAISEKAASIGTTINLGKLPLDLSYVHAFSQEITGSNQPHKLGSEYVNSRTTMSENVFTVGAIWRP